MTDDIIIEAVCFDLRGYTIINIDFILINVPSLAKSQIYECPKCFLTQVAMEMFVFDSSNYERCNMCY